ncbi:MAG TPA: diacylglycerol kinase family protein [Bacilli bacterium]|nr:diacylglycerol kinase family protein [Bacilli bacterium]
MPAISRDDIKTRGLSRFRKSFIYSIEGLKYAFKYEQSLTIHILATVVVILTNILLKVTFAEWATTLLTIGVVLAMELINTAIEAVVDLVTLEIHPLAKIAKDCGSAATFVMAVVSIIIALLVYGPYIVNLLS